MSQLHEMCYRIRKSTIATEREISGYIGEVREIGCCDSAVPVQNLEDSIRTLRCLAFTLDELRRIIMAAEASVGLVVIAKAGAEIYALCP